MKEYYRKRKSEKGQHLLRSLIGRAWSLMECRRARSGERHKPHVWNNDYVIYGPYCCVGHPARKVKTR